MRVVFMGTPDFAATALKALMEANHEICAIYTQPPRPAKRGKKQQRSPVHTLAQDYGLEIRTPPSQNHIDAHGAFRSLGADVAVVAAYGLLLPQAVLAAPRYGCLNIHASLLPRWRGAAPIHRALEAGDEKTGISIMQMEEGLDTGPILLTHEISIDPHETQGTLHDRLAILGAKAIVEALENLETLTPIPQDRQGISYAKKISKQETPLDWSQSPQVIARKIRALSPFPGAWFQLKGERIKVLNARPADMPPQPQVQSLTPLIIGGVELLEVQRAGKRPQTAQEFLRGFPITLGQSIL